MQHIIPFRSINVKQNLKKMRTAEEVTPKSLLFLSPPIASKHSAFPLTKDSASKVPAILKKFVSGKKSTLDAAILKLYLVARLWLGDVILSNLKLVGSRKTC